MRVKEVSGKYMIYADIDKVKTIVQDLYPRAQNISIVTHGYDNIVALVDEIYAVRFPQSLGAQARSRYEQQVLTELDSLGDFNIPKVLGSDDNPPYLITSFIPGHHLNSTEVNSLPFDKQKEIGRRLAAFAYEMHARLAVDQALVHRRQFGLDDQVEEPWDIYFKKVLFDSQLPTREQDVIAKEYYDKWVHLIYSTPMVVVHDDLHTQNMMFEADRLTGILDFGDTNVGQPEQELRQLYRINQEILNEAIETYELISGYSLNREAVKTWAVMQELAVYAELAVKGEVDRPGYIRAVRNLSKWLGQDLWLNQNDKQILSDLDQ